MTITSDVKNKAADVAASVKSATDGVAETASNQAQAAASHAKNEVASQISGVAQALRSAATELSSGSVAERSLGQIANGFADASESLQGKDLGELISAASSVAKRNPTLFIGGAVLLGFAASRFLKSSAPRAATHDVHDFDRDYTA